MQPVDWDELRLILAVAESGSLNAAAQRLAVNHTTVLRRLAAIEKRLGLALFERAPTGQALTPAVERALPALVRMADAAWDAERQMIGSHATLTGTLRVTTTDTLAVTLVADIIAAFGAAHPALVIELATSNAFANLTRREADVAIRPASDPPESLVGRRVGSVAFAIYGAAGREPNPQARWIGVDDSLAASAVGRWLAEHGPTNQVARCDSLVAARELAAAGVGNAVLPRYLGDPDIRLRRLEVLTVTSDLWVLAHADLARSARIQAFTAFAGEQLRHALAANRDRVRQRARQTRSMPTDSSR